MISTWITINGSARAPIDARRSGASSPSSPTSPTRWSSTNEAHSSCGGASPVQEGVREPSCDGPPVASGRGSCRTRSLVRVSLAVAGAVPATSSRLSVPWRPECAWSRSALATAPHVVCQLLSRRRTLSAFGPDHVFVPVLLCFSAASTRESMSVKRPQSTGPLVEFLNVSICHSSLPRCPRAPSILALRADLPGAPHRCEHHLFT